MKFAFYILKKKGGTISVSIKKLSLDEVSENLNALEGFLHTHLGRYRDDRSAIRKGFEYLLSETGGGQAYVLTHQSQISGVCLTLKTHMKEFLPENFLLYIAIDSDRRGNGLGRQLLEFVQNDLGTEICLHVEKDNPAKSLYERMGFTNKYDEMRYYPNGNS